MTAPSPNLHHISPWSSLSRRLSPPPRQSVGSGVLECAPAAMGNGDPLGLKCLLPSGEWITVSSSAFLPRKEKAVSETLPSVVLEGIFTLIFIYLLCLFCLCGSLLLVVVDELGRMDGKARRPHGLLGGSLMQRGASFLTRCMGNGNIYYPFESD